METPAASAVGIFPGNGRVDLTEIAPDVRNKGVKKRQIVCAFVSLTVLVSHFNIAVHSTICENFFGAFEDCLAWY